SYVCNGAAGANGTEGSNGDNAVVVTATEPGGTNCAHGGVRIDTGLDTDGDGVIDGVPSTKYVCNGADGHDGSDGDDAIVTTTLEPSGPNCAHGGVRIETGSDTD